MSQEAQATLAKRAESECRFVDVDEFHKLAISSRQLIRCDDVEAGLRGLCDPASGARFMIEEEKLYARRRGPQSVGA